MILQTNIPLNPQEPQIDYNSRILLLGSCFSEHIGDKMDYLKFNVLQNPFGILFHPIAIEKIIDRAINKNYFEEKDIFLHDELWCCFEVHSSLRNENKKEYLEHLNSKLAELEESIHAASHIIITYGTSWVYEFRESKEVVSNCYKIPQKEFEKKLLDVSEIEESLSNTMDLIRRSNSNSVIIPTVSPVRHLKDGFIENNRSKAHLITAIQKLTDQKDDLIYFPAYEIMMDELRDYRFYKLDMIHPNDTAISIIWDKFSKVWISSETEEIQREIANIQTGLKHKPFHPSGDQYQFFLKDLKERIKSIQKRFPFIKF
jgi:lysophospholipase L1-like esterase